MGSANTKCKPQPRRRTPTPNEDNLVHKQTITPSSIKKALHHAEPVLPVSMATNVVAPVTSCPHLPLLDTVQGGALIPQPLPPQGGHEGYETVHALYNLLNNGFRMPFIHLPDYMLILDARERECFSKLHILTARHHTAIDTDYDCLIDGDILKRFTHIVLYDGRSGVTEMDPGLKDLANRLRAKDLDPVVLDGGFEAFSLGYHFLCNDLLIRSEKDRAREIRTYPSEIIEGALFQGNAKNANSHAVVKNLGITHVVNVTTECGNSFEGECKYLQLKYTDELRSNMKHRLPAAADFIAGALRDGGRVLVHCVEGVSRSSTVTLSFLMKYRAWSLTDAMDFLRSKRPMARPNRAFLIQLADLEQDLFGKRLSNVDEIWLS